MAKQKEPINPFYTLVVLLGVLFAITAFAYGTMAYRAVAQEESGRNLMTLLDEHGAMILTVELGLLGLATFGVMWLEGVYSRRKESSQEKPASPSDRSTSSDRQEPLQ